MQSYVAHSPPIRKRWCKSGRKADWTDLFRMPLRFSEKGIDYSLPRATDCAGLPHIVVLAQYNSGRGTTDIAREHGVSRHSLMNGLEKMGMLRSKQTQGNTIGMRAAVEKRAAALAPRKEARLARIEAVRAARRAQKPAPLTEEQKKAKRHARYTAEYAANKERYRERSREYQRALRAKMTPEERRAKSDKCMDWFRANKGRKQIHFRRWAAKHPEKWKEIKRRASKARRATPEGRMLENLRKRLRGVVKASGGTINRLVGCTGAFLREHMQGRFQPFMTWDNYGARYGWHVDHVIPIASFDLRDPLQVSAANHWTNLQPLWWFQNQDKSDRTDWRLPDPLYEAIHGDKDPREVDMGGACQEAPSVGDGDRQLAPPPWCAGNGELCGVARFHGGSTPEYRQGRIESGTEGREGPARDQAVVIEDISGRGPHGRPLRSREDAA